jgi:hypothetical protein
MALSKEQWFQKLKGWVPTWFFEAASYQEAHFYALADLLSKLQTEMETHKSETFISTASAPQLDLHGAERTTPRLTAELNGSYQVRIRSLANKVNKPALKAIVDELLLVGECTIVEDWEGASFFSREAFFNRGALVIDLIHNTFTVLFDNQRPQPFAYNNREYFANRDDYMTSLTTPTAFFDAIVQAIEDNKALGTLYRVVERLEA